LTSSSSSSASSPPADEPLDELESGYRSDSSPDVLSDDGADSCSSKAGDDEGDGDGNMMERIFFLREKQRILERASNYLSREREARYAAATAYDLCRGLAAESSNESGSLDDGRARRQPSSIWSEARRFLDIMNRRTDGDGDSSSFLPVPTRICRKRCAPNPRNPLIDPQIVKMITAKLYESGSDTDSSTGSAEPLSETESTKTVSTLSVDKSEQVRATPSRLLTPPNLLTAPC
jgi:hypothetical protein